MRRKNHILDKDNTVISGEDLQNNKYRIYAYHIFGCIEFIKKRTINMVLNSQKEMTKMTK
jgi:hypothetical protein